MVYLTFGSSQPYVINFQKGGRMWKAYFITEALYLFMKPNRKGILSEFPPLDMS